MSYFLLANSDFVQMRFFQTPNPQIPPEMVLQIMHSNKVRFLFAHH